MLKQECVWWLGHWNNVGDGRIYKQVFLGSMREGPQVCRDIQREELRAQGLHPMRDSEPLKEFRNDKVRCEFRNMTLVAKWRMNWRSKRWQITSIGLVASPHTVTSKRANGGRRD